MRELVQKAEFDLGLERWVRFQQGKSVKDRKGSTR